MESNPNSHFLLILSGYLCFYLLLHSWLASQWVKLRLRRLCHCSAVRYRQGYNLLALFLLIPLWILYTNQNWQLLWQWSGVMEYVQISIWLFAAVVFIYTLGFYDNRAFIGVHEDSGQLTLSPVHRFVRHPWYTCLLMIMWSQDMTDGLLASSIIISFYLAIGSHLEEKRLPEQHRKAYADYIRAVPALIPRPWRYLGRQQAASLNRKFKNDPESGDS